MVLKLYSLFRLQFCSLKFKPTLNNCGKIGQKQTEKRRNVHSFNSRSLRVTLFHVVFDSSAKDSFSSEYLVII